MVFVFAGVTIFLCGVALRDELRPGGMLDWRGRGADDQALADLLEFPVPAGWSRDDVVRTYAEISSL